MKQTIKEILDLAEWGMAILFAVVIGTAVIIWIHGSEALKLSVPWLIYTLVIVGCIAAVYWLATYAIARFYGTRATVAERNRDYVLARNEAEHSNISTQRSRLHLEVENAMAVQQIGQMSQGMIFANHFGESTFASHTKGIATTMNTSPLLGEPLPKLSNLLPKAQRILIAGGQNAGKTTICQWIAYYKLQHGRVIVIDSHATPVRWPNGCEVIGAAQDYAAIERLLQWLMQEMKKRFQDQAAGKVPERGHEIISVVSDEWTLLPQVIKDVGRYTGPLLTETRKAGFDFYLAAHDTTVEALGIQGKGGLRRAFDFAVLCDYDFEKGDRHTYVNFMKGGRVSEKDNKEYEPPGPFVIQGEAQPITNNPLLTETGDVWDFSQATESLLDQQVINEYLKTGSYSRAYRLLYRLENDTDYEGAIGGNQTAKVKAILDKHHITHPVSQ